MVSTQNLVKLYPSNSYSLNLYVHTSNAFGHP